MKRQTLLLTLFAPTLVALLAAGPAAADERVPRITNAQLPIAGTCAPIRRTGVTHVMVGERTSLQWFRVAGLAEPVEFHSLVKILKSRAGTGTATGAAATSEHSVWITASADHAWIHAIRVRQACLGTGIYRVGLRVRSEATGQVMGFPLFLPPAASGRSSGKAGQLRVRINTLGERAAKAASDVGHVYAAASRAREQRTRFGVDQIVASLWVATNAPLQYAVQAIDLLYRGGCAGVKLRYGARVPPLKFKAIPKIEIQGGMVSRLPQPLKPAPVQPLPSPWSLNGAALPGWVDLEVMDLPALDGSGGPAKAKADPEMRPNYAAAGSGVPADVFRSVDAEARIWAQRLGEDLLAGVSGSQPLQKRFVVALRREEVFPSIMAPLRKTFPDATRVIPATIQFHAFLFGRGKLRGRADVTLAVSVDRVRIIEGRWRPLDPKSSLTLAPFAVDPYASGGPSAWRIWFEGVFHDVKKRGREGLPLASAEAVTPFFPRVARPGVARTIAGREKALEELVRQISFTSYDRLVLSASRGTAAVYARDTVVGVLNFGLNAEEHALRLDELTARRAH